MKIKECEIRKEEYKKMLENIELLKLALTRSISIENLNIASLKDKEKK